MIILMLLAYRLFYASLTFRKQTFDISVTSNASAASASKIPDEHAHTIDYMYTIYYIDEFHLYMMIFDKRMQCQCALLKPSAFMPRRKANYKEKYHTAA